MFGWRSYFEKINIELETAERKKQALNSLLEKGKISKETFDIFNAEIDSTIQEIEKQKCKLLERMNNKARELENHIKILERTLANFEIQWVGGEIDEESYKSGVEAVIAGMENAKNELKIITELTYQLTNPTITCKGAEQKVQEVSKPTELTSHIEEAGEPKATIDVEVIEQSSGDTQLQKVETPPINVESSENLEAIQTVGTGGVENVEASPEQQKQVDEKTEVTYEESSEKNEEAPQ